MWGIEIFGVQFSGVSLNTGNLPLNEEFHPDSCVALKLDSFLKQTVAMIPLFVIRSAAESPREAAPSVLLTRRDILYYVANKIGGVHYDPKPNGRLTKEKIDALGRIRHCFKIELQGNNPSVLINLDSLEEDQTSTFKYEPESIDAVYLEFIACVELILRSTEVSTLKALIESDLKITR